MSPVAWLEHCKYVLQLTYWFAYNQSNDIKMDLAINLVGALISILIKSTSAGRV